MPTLTSLLEGVDGLNPEVIERAEAILEARAQEIAQTKIDESKEAHQTELTQLGESHQTQLTEAQAEGREALVESLDQFLDATIKEWALDNAVAIDGAIKVQLAESMLTGMAGLMAEHNVTVPEGAENLVESLELQIEELTETSDHTLAENVRLNSEINQMHRKQVETTVLEGLAETQKERVLQLAEGTEFKGVESYTARIDTFRSIVVEGKDKDKEKEGDDKDGDKDPIKEDGDKDKKPKKDPKPMTENVGASAAAQYLASLNG
ncbi:head scaffolding protein [Vibrio phage K469]